MLNHLFELSLQRSKKEAAAFYIAYNLLGICVGGVMGFLAPLNTGRQEILRFGYLLSIFYVLVIGIFLLVKKGKQTSVLSWILVGLSPFLTAYWIGTLTGLIPLAYLTTLPNGTPTRQKTETI